MPRNGNGNEKRASRRSSAVGSKRYHFSLSVDVDRFSDWKLRKDGYLKLVQANGIATLAELREQCAELRAKGFTAFPPCDAAGPTGTCMGHPCEETDSG